MEKKCSQCNITKKLEEFGKYKRSKDGLKPYCKECGRKASREYYKKRRREVLKNQHYYEQDNKEEINRKRREHYWKNRDKILARRKELAKIKEENEREEVNRGYDYDSFYY